MEYKEIKKYMSDMETSKLDELKIEFPDGTKIEMKKNTNKMNCSEDIIPQQFIQAASQQIAQSMPNSTQQINKVVVNTEENTVSALVEQEENFKKIKSPMVGTFYSKPAPNAEAFVKVGDRVYTAAGTTVTKDVPDDALVIGRVRQEVKEDWTRGKIKGC